MADNYEYYEEEPGKAPPPPNSPPPKSPPPKEPAAGQDYDYYYDENNPTPPPAAAAADAPSAKPAESPAMSPKPSPTTTAAAPPPPPAPAKPHAESPIMSPKASVTLPTPASAKHVDSPAMSPKASPVTQPPTAVTSPTVLPKTSPVSPTPGKDATTLFLFDVDGTLTPLKGNISSETTEFLKKLMQKVCVGVVSGSDTRKLSEQLRGMEDSLDYVCAENGTYFHKKGEKPVTTSISDKLGNDKMKKYMDFILDYMSKLQIPAKKGNFIETRNNMINISPVGRTANDKEREEFKAFDKENSVRRKFVSELGAKFKDYDLSYNIAGDISFDVYPKGWDKSFCLQLLEKEHFKAIHFFGDKVNKGENDYEIYHDKRVTGHRVTGPDDTKKQVSELLHL